MAKRSDKTPITDKYTPISVYFATEESNPTDNNPFPIPTKEHFCRDLKERIKAGIKGRQNFGFDDNVRRYRRYHDLVVTPKSLPWDGCSNIAPYIGRAIVETVHANLYHTIFGIDTWFHFQAEDPNLSDVAERREIAFQSQVEDQIKLRTKGDDIEKCALVDGTAITMATYRYEVSKTVRMEKITGPLLAELVGLSYDGGKTAATQAQGLAAEKISQLQTQLTQQAQQQAVQPSQPQEPGMLPTPAPNAQMQNVLTGEAQQQTAARIQQTLSQAQQEAAQEVQQAQQQAAAKEDADLLKMAIREFPFLQGKNIGDYAPIWRKRDVIRDSPDVVHIDILDYVVYPANSKAQESDKGEWRRVWRSRDDLWRGVSSGIYDKDAVRDVTDKNSQASTTEEYMKGGDPARTYRKGINVYAETIQADVPYECFEGIYYIDVDGDGEEEKLWVEIEINSEGEEGLIRCEYYPFFFGETPFDLFCPNRVSATQGRYGDSIYQVIQHGLKLYKKVMDQRIDRGDLVISAPVAVDQRIKHNWAESRWRIGMMIRCMDPGNAFIPAKIPDVTESSFANVEQILTDVKMAAAVGNTQLQQAASSGTPLGETQAILESSSLRFDVMIDRCRTAYGSMAQKIDYLNQQYHPEMLAPQVNPDGSISNVILTPEEMMAGMKISVHGTSSMNNAQLRSQIAEKVYLSLERAGYTIDPVIKRRIMLTILASMGQPDPENLLPSQQEVNQEKQNPVPMQPEKKTESVSRKMDEVANLAVMLYVEKTITEDQYRLAAMLARDAENILLPPPQGADEQAATDTAAGYSQASQQAAAQGNAQGVS